ncbi:MAG: trimeric intracellular cation channel family protein [Clostridia bacterium]|nr:trimeric intracellular cation channel family protein [Clostridia bacterium]
MDTMLLVLELIGTCAFAISGAVLGITKRFDIFGVIFSGIITALGGGTIRDILLGNLPPAMFRNYIYLIFAVATCLLTFIIASILKNKFSENIVVIDKVNNIFDAIGLGVFTIVGMNVAIRNGFVHNFFFVVFLGMTTGCGGGILRDVIVSEVPFVLKKRVYAVASIVGGIVYYLMYITFDQSAVLSAVVGITLIFVLRILASVFKWDLPKAI